MRRAWLLVCLLVPGSVEAQVPDSGMRIRVTPASGPRRIGWMVRPVGDSIEFMSEESMRKTRVSLAGTQIELSYGNQGRALQGALIGMGVGAGAAAALVFGHGSEWGDVSQAQALAAAGFTFGMAGGLIGLVIGANTYREGWIPAPTVRPGPGGGLGLTWRLRF